MFKNKKLWITLFVGLLLAVSGLVLIKYYVENNGHRLDGYDAISDEPKNKTSTITHVASTTKATTKPSEDPNYKKFTSTVYGFSFLYPKEYNATINTANPKYYDPYWVSIELPQKSFKPDDYKSGVAEAYYDKGVEIKVWKAESYDNLDVSEKYFTNNAFFFANPSPCGAAGVGSIDCDTISNKKKFYNSHNLLCYEFYLDVNVYAGQPPNEDGESTTPATLPGVVGDNVGEVGPNYACDITHKTNRPARAIIIYPIAFESDPVTYKIIPLSAENKKKIYDIVNSIQF